MPNLEEGGSRRLTPGERVTATKIFKNSINYSSGRIHNGSYLLFNMQSKNTAMTPNGEMYFREPYYKDDFSLSIPQDIHWFIHEMAHVLQYQLGMNVRTRGVFSWAVSYEYSLPPDSKLSDYGMEQQASNIADYFYLKCYGLSDFERISGFKGIIGPDLLQKYESVLSFFLVDASNKKVFM